MPRFRVNVGHSAPFEQSAIDFALIRDELRRIGCFGPFEPNSNSVPQPNDVLSLVRELNRILLERVSNNPSFRSLLIDAGQTSRFALCLVIALASRTSLFKELVVAYAENRYTIAGTNLLEGYKRDDFWHLVFDYPSRLVPVPFLSGRYDASLPRSVFICGGLDFGRVLNLAARWEPKEVTLVADERPNEMDRQLLAEYRDVLVSHHHAGRLDVGAISDALEAWWADRVLDQDVQPLLVCGGWKSHATAACLWAIENKRTPTFTCVPDFVVSDVIVERGPRSVFSVTDESVWF